MLQSLPPIVTLNKYLDETCDEISKNLAKSLKSIKILVGKHLQNEISPWGVDMT